jgi:hypothetical protein
MFGLLSKLRSAVIRDPLGVALIVWRPAIIIEAALTMLFTALTAMVIVGTKCADMSVIAGYQNVNIWGGAFLSLLAVVLVVSRSNTAKIKEYLRDYVEPVYWLGPVRLTFGE